MGTTQKDKLQEQRRDAIGLALEWLDPIEIALMQASALAMSFLNKRIDKEALEREWPIPSRNTARINIPARLRILVLSDIVELANEINFLLL